MILSARIIRIELSIRLDEIVSVFSGIMAANVPKPWLIAKDLRAGVQRQLMCQLENVKVFHGLHTLFPPY
jgi:hypothetical protein